MWILECPRMGVTVCQQNQAIFLGSYVDDFHMSGVGEKMKQALDDLTKHMESREIRFFGGGSYLGCIQLQATISEPEVKESKDWYGYSLGEKASCTAQDFEWQPIPGQKKSNENKKEKPL